MESEETNFSSGIAGDGSLASSSLSGGRVEYHRARLGTGTLGGDTVRTPAGMSCCNGVLPNASRVPWATHCERELHLLLGVNPWHHWHWLHHCAANLVIPHGHHTLHHHHHGPSYPAQVHLVPQEYSMPLFVFLAVMLLSLDTISRVLSLSLAAADFDPLGKPCGQDLQDHCKEEDAHSVQDVHFSVSSLTIMKRCPFRGVRLGT